MSHYATIETQIRDLDALRAACAELSVLLLENAEARGFGGSTRKGEYVIRLKGPFDIALDRDASGCFRLTTDWWDGHVEKEVGFGYGKLLQLYAVHKAALEARQRGFRVRRQNQDNGAIQLILEAK